MYVAPILAALATLAICLLAKPLAMKLRIMDVPDGVRKRHKAPTPLIGGLAIAVPMVGMGLFLSMSDGDSGFFVRLSIAIAVAFLIGFADDRHDLSPTLRLFLSFALCLGVFSGDSQLIIGILHSSWEHYSLSLGSWAWPFTMVATVGFVYAFNMTDGMDGLAIGQGLIWTILLLLTNLGELDWYLITLAAALAVTFWFNLAKKLFLGDSGAYALSIIFGLMIIYNYNHTPNLKADTIVVWLLFPVLDCLRLILMRVATRVSPLTPDNNHFHHYLSTLLPHAFVVPAILSVISAGGILTVFMPEQTLIWLGISFAIYAIVILIVNIKRRSSRA